MLFLIAFLAMVAASSAGNPDKGRKWDGLRVTWGKNQSDPNLFVRYPRTETDAKNEGFEMISDCDLNAPWRGKRYIKNKDPYVVLLFDIKGYIAGIQTTVPKSLSNEFPSPLIRPPFVDDGDRWAISAYFTDPSKICTTGRTAEQFALEGTGSNLYIQNSTVPELSTVVPSRIEGTATTLWTRAKCFPVMGIHHYYDLRLDLDCNELFPVTLLYNNGQLTVFAWTLLVAMPSNRFEQSTQNIFPYFMDPVPTCMNQYDIVSTQHVYLTDDYTLNQC
jgi:hypothetical protein